MIAGLLGRKVGMVQAIDKDGRMRGATVIEAGPCLVTQIKTKDRDGYEAVQLGFGAAKRSSKPMRGHLKRLGDLRHLREFKVEGADQHKVGDRVGVEIFQPGDRVDVTATSKGRGFAGGVRRYGFRGGPKTHGQSDRHRAPGSVGAGNTPGRTFKGLRMAGHLGAQRVTVRNLEVIQSNPARGILLVAGAVPGARNGLVTIRYSLSTLPEARTRKPQPVETPPPARDETPSAAEEQAAPEAVADEAAPEAAEAPTDADAEAAAETDADTDDAPEAEADEPEEEQPS